MPIPPHLPQLQYGYDDGFTTIVFGLIGSCLGCNLILLISFFEYKLIFFFFKFYYLNLLTTQQKYIFSSGSIWGEF